MKPLSIIKLLLCASILAVLCGCVTKGWQGALPGKDFHAKNVKITIHTMAGAHTFEADELTTIVSTNAGLLFPH